MTTGKRAQVRTFLLMLASAVIFAFALVATGLYFYGNNRVYLSPQGGHQEEEASSGG